MTREEMLKELGSAGIDCDWDVNGGWLGWQLSSDGRELVMTFEPLDRMEDGSYPAPVKRSWLLIPKADD